MSLKYNVVIIGAGNIGAFFDNPRSEDILTHAHGFSMDERFNLLGFVDINKEKGQKAAELWGCNYYGSIDGAKAGNKIDIVCIAVPDELHFEYLKKAMDMDVKLIFCEKPITKNLKDAEKLLEIYSSKNAKIVVNYSRRFVDEFYGIKNDYNGGKYGKFLTGTGYYGKGIMHNGSHMVDLLGLILGEVKENKALSGTNDFYADDPTVSVYLKFDEGGVILSAADCRAYTVFEADLLFEKKRIKILNSGFSIESYDIVDSPIFKGYKSLEQTGLFDTSLKMAMMNAVRNIGNHLEGNEEIKCSFFDAYKTLKICSSIRKGI